MEKTYIEKIHIARNRLKAEYKDIQQHLIKQIKKLETINKKKNMIKNLKVYLKIISHGALIMKEIYIH